MGVHRSASFTGSKLAAAAALGCAAALSACQPDATFEPGAPDPPDDEEEWTPPPDGADLPAFCWRRGASVARDLFCNEALMPVRNLRELKDKLGMGYWEPGTAPTPNSGLDIRLVVLGHSTALSGRVVSPINPRALVLAPGTVLAFNRGVQQVEIASYDRLLQDLDFFLVSFDQACNAAPQGCTPGDLYTPRIEENWVAVRVQDDDDLKNTPSDCRRCHQQVLTKEPALLMRELEGPWTHFFLADEGQQPGYPEPTGVDLTRDYLSAKGNEPYAGIPTPFLRATAGFTLENFVGRSQPLVFDSVQISNERWHFVDGEYLPEPTRSPTWDQAYAAFQRGEQLALPHYEPRPTDANKQALLTAAYQRYLSGEISAEALPDLSDIFPDDPARRAEIGLQTTPDASPAEILVQACGSCHNDVLDQTISRARFNIDLKRMDRAELEIAIQRLNAPAGAGGRMPPPESRQLDPAAQERLIAYLQQSTRSATDDALLERAASLGMAGGR
jgi:hypothetical protein